MIGLSHGVVVEILHHTPGIQELVVRVGTELRPTFCQTALVGVVEAGDRVVVNDTARRLSLGSGGYDYVQSICDKLPDYSAGQGHIMRLRYTPLQHAVLSCEEQQSTHHDVLKEADDLGGLPVVCTGLHSQVAAVAAGVAAVNPSLRVVYVMTDTACLHIGVSKLVTQLKHADLLHGTVTCGQAFGGDLEAVNLFTALLAAKHVLHADVVIAGQGVGNTGTGTRFGFSGVDQGICLNAVNSLNGLAIAVLRISEGDARPRHQGLSHHSLTVLQKVCMAGCVVPLPSDGGEYSVSAEESLRDLPHEHRIDTVAGQPALDVLAQRGVHVKSMGRSVEHDRVFFLAAGAAGIVAAMKAPSNARL